jgi:putative transposase
MRRAYRHRLYPTRTQREALTTQLAFASDLYNAALEQRRDAWRLRRKGLRYIEQAADLTEVRRAGLAPEMNCWTQQDALRRLDLAFAAFFRRCRAGEKPGYPRFRFKCRYDSLRWSFAGNAGGVALRDRRLYLQGVGHVKVKWHRAIPEAARLATATVTRRGRHWEACFSLELPTPEPVERAPSPVGLDLGVAVFAALSTGELIAGPRAGARATAQVRRHQRTVSRRHRGSQRRRKAVAVLARARDREREVRRDHRHKLARALVSRFTLIAVEDLAISNMTRSARGSIEAPGRHIRRKAGLNRAQLDQAWGAFLTTLSSKAEEAGTTVVRVDPRNTSRACSECGVIDARSRRSQAEFVCTVCGHALNADVNAARNILRLGSSRQAPTVEVGPRAA